MTTRLINPQGLALIKGFEGLRLQAYKDPASVWTIGYGHTGGVHKGDIITADQAERLLIQDLADAENWVGARTQAPTDNQFAAMVSLTVNIGNGAFLGSSVRRLHNEGNFAGAANAFLLWDKAHVNGQLVVVQGLLNRRHAERAFYLS